MGTWRHSQFAGAGLIALVLAITATGGVYPGPSSIELQPTQNSPSNIVERTPLARKPTSATPPAASGAALSEAEILERAWQHGQRVRSLAQAAASQATRRRVAEFARTVFLQQSILAGRVRLLAQERGIPLLLNPAGPAGARTDSLRASEPEKLENTFLRALIREHQQAVPLYGEAARAGAVRNLQLQQLAELSLALVRGHLSRAAELSGPPNGKSDQEDE